MEKVAVIGAGALGTALAQTVAENVDEVYLHLRREELKDEINNIRFNNEYYPNTQLKDNIIATTDYNYIIDSSYLLMRYEGFWQSSKYFDSIALCIKKAFSFREDIINEKTATTTDYLLHSNSVSVHIRRGDYLLESETRGLCSLEYYKKAMSIICERVNNPSFIFFPMMLIG